VSGWNNVRDAQFELPDFTFPVSAIARALAAAIAGDPVLMKRLISLLTTQDDIARAERAVNVEACLIEVLMGNAHRVISKDDRQLRGVSVQKIATAVNDVLRSRGGIQEYSAEEVGNMLNKLGMPKKRSASGMLVPLHDETARQVHRLAAWYRVSMLEFRGLKCPWCEGQAQVES
jgi:hypothetical protein